MRALSAYLIVRMGLSASNYWCPREHCLYVEYPVSFLYKRGGRVLYVTALGRETSFTFSCDDENTPLPTLGD